MPAGHLSALEALGRDLFEDNHLSGTHTQSCASCHDSGAAFSGNGAAEDASFPVARSADGTQLGTRNAPSAMYGSFVPPFGFTIAGTRISPTGGFFWDGRADTLAAQASQPLLNPREMQMPDKAAVVAEVADASYARSFVKVFGPGALEDTDAAFGHVTDAIEAFEQTRRFAPFSSKFDAMLRGQAELNDQEALGFSLFQDPDQGNCTGCHEIPDASSDPAAYLFTAYAYRALGVPRNPAIPDNADPEHYDLGLCQQPGLADKLPAEMDDPDAVLASWCGRFRVPSLRNVAVTPPYMHNGVFRDLRQVVSFYATRDTDPERWYPVDDGGSIHKFDDLPADYRANVSQGHVPFDREPGEAPHLDEAEVDAIVAFLCTLTDGYAQATP